MSDWPFLNRHRIQGGLLASTPDDGFNGAFSFPVRGCSRWVTAIASDGLGWEHVSVSFGPNSMACPRWEIMCQVKELFWEPEACVVQFHPPSSTYRNLHPGCLHMWRPTGGGFPRPSPDMVA